MRYLVNSGILLNVGMCYLVIAGIILNVLMCYLVNSGILLNPNQEKTYCQQCQEIVNFSSTTSDNRIRKMQKTVNQN